MTAELHAIRLSLGIINDTPYSNVICSDSMSSVQSIDNYTENNHLLHRLVYQMHESILRGNHITISWVPSHVGICGNERADRSEEHTSELQSLREISYAVFCLKKKHETDHIEKTENKTELR